MTCKHFHFNAISITYYKKAPRTRQDIKLKLHAQLLISVILFFLLFFHEHSYENVVMSFIKKI